MKRLTVKQLKDVLLNKDPEISRCAIDLGRKTTLDELRTAITDFMVKEISKRVGMIIDEENLIKAFNEVMEEATEEVLKGDK